MSTLAASLARCSAAVVWLQATATESPYTASTGKLAATPGSLSSSSAPKRSAAVGGAAEQYPRHLARGRRPRPRYTPLAARPRAARAPAGPARRSRSAGRRSVSPPSVGAGVVDAGLALLPGPPGRHAPRPWRPPRARARREGSPDRPSRPPGREPARPGLAAVGRAGDHDVADVAGQNRAPGDVDGAIARRPRRRSGSTGRWDRSRSADSASQVLPPSVERLIHTPDFPFAGVEPGGQQRAVRRRGERVEVVRAELGAVVHRHAARSRSGPSRSSG